MTRTFTVVIQDMMPDEEAEDIQDALEQAQFDVVSVTPTPSTTLQQPPQTDLNQK